MKSVDSLATPAALLQPEKMTENCRRMQDICRKAGVGLWPHIKTHKTVAILKAQLALGAEGATCAKLGEAEAMIPSGVRRIFMAHSLSDLRHAPRLRQLHSQLDELILAVTSSAHWEVLEKIVAAADIQVPVALAVDTGLSREGVRNVAEARTLAQQIRGSRRLQLVALYTHEGHAYGATSPEEVDQVAARVHAHLIDVREAVGGNLPLWPGCSVTATRMVGREAVTRVRPGSYVLGDLSLTESTQTMDTQQPALSILATVVDRPTSELALIDAGSKVFSSDRSRAGLYARCVDRPELVIQKVSEEHGYLTGPGVGTLPIGTRLRFCPAHVCPVMNLAREVHWVRGSDVLETYPVDARGRSD